MTIRPPLYLHTVDPPPKRPKRLHPLKVFCSARHSLHHIRERGYVERPARVDVILKAISDLPDVERLPVRNFGEGPIRAVHDVDFVNYLKNICTELPPGELLYPYVFPIRRTDRPPYDRTRSCRLLLHRHVHAPEPRRLQGRPGRGERGPLGALGDPRRRAARLLALPPARPSRRARHLRRLLLLLQRRDRRAVPRDQARRQDRGARRRLPPRQRHAGHLLHARSTS